VVKRKNTKKNKASEASEANGTNDTIVAEEAEPVTADKKSDCDISPKPPLEMDASAKAHGITLEQHQRLLAEFDNFRKRADRDYKRIDLWARAEVMTAVLPILDDFERARQASPPEDNSFDKQGMLIIINRLAEILTKEGLDPIKADPGDVFDPEIHEAVLMVPSTDIPAGCVVEVLEKGFRVKERLLRPAKVVVAREPDTQQE
jgi:molecular chaperone GrpE